MNDRIKLAEAMGWATVMEGELWSPPDFTDMALRDYPPNPFTDANDDYAVLEWARKKGYTLPTDQRFSINMYLPHISLYQIGDYARAALKVIE